MKRACYIWVVCAHFARNPDLHRDRVLLQMCQILIGVVREGV